MRDRPVRQDRLHKRRRGAEQFSPIRPLAEDRGRDQHDDERRHIVAQAGERHRRLHIGGEQEDPVQAKANAGKDQPFQVSANGMPVHSLMPGFHVQKDEHGANDSPAHRHDLTRQGNISQQHSDGSIEDDGCDILDAFKGRIHCATSMFLRQAGQ